MQSGIIKNKGVWDTFEWINNERVYCSECCKCRSKFKRQNQQFGRFSNLLPGFSSPKQKEPPIDLLIILESHGGGRERTFREQKNLAYEVQDFESYYLKGKLEKFHQYIMRYFFEVLNDNDVTWVATDLIKCYTNKENSENFRMAANHCKGYLNEQIKTLKPKNVLCLGTFVRRNYFNIQNKKEHGEIEDFEFKTESFNMIFKLMFSLFPSQMTADRWLQNEGWAPILRELKLSRK